MMCNMYNKTCDVKLYVTSKNIMFKTRLCVAFYNRWISFFPRVIKGKVHRYSKVVSGKDVNDDKLVMIQSLQL